MRKVDLKNKELLSILKEAEWFVENHDILEEHLHLNGSNVAPDEWISEEYKRKVITEGRAHEGYPVTAKGYSLKPEQIKYKKFNEEIATRYDDVNMQLMSFFGTRHNALFHVYPPGGFLAWHNNANASSYNLIFTFNKTGEGYFSYHDWNTNETVQMDDKPGWSCKYGFFGSYKDPREKLVYHTAYTDVWRMTVSYIYNAYDTEIGKEFQQQVIDEISIE
jgi:hypothetical protein